MYLYYSYLAQKQDSYCMYLEMFSIFKVYAKQRLAIENKGWITVRSQGRLSTWTPNSWLNILLLIQIIIITICIQPDKCLLFWAQYETQNYFDTWKEMKINNSFLSCASITVTAKEITKQKDINIIMCKKIPLELVLKSLVCSNQSSQLHPKHLELAPDIIIILYIIICIV